MTKKTNRKPSSSTSSTSSIILQIDEVQNMNVETQEERDAQIRRASPKVEYTNASLNNLGIRQAPKKMTTHRPITPNLALRRELFASPTSSTSTDLDAKLSSLSLRN